MCLLPITWVNTFRLNEKLPQNDIFKYGSQYNDIPKVIVALRIEIRTYL